MRDDARLTAGTAVIVIIVIATFGVYEISSAQTSPPSTTKTSASTTTTAYTSTSYFSTSTYASPYYYYFDQAATKWFASYRQATFSFNGNTSLPSAFDLTIGYTVVGQTTNASSGLPLTMVNFTEMGRIGSSQVDRSSLIYFNTTLYAQVVTQNNFNETGSEALKSASNITLYWFRFFTLPWVAGAPLQTGEEGPFPPSPFGQVNDTFGSTAMPVTNFTSPDYDAYRWCSETSCMFGHVTYANMLVSYGNYYQSFFAVLTHFSADQVSVAGSNLGAISLQLLSITKKN